jgi:hypothetical protein
MRKILLFTLLLATVAGCGPRWYYPHLDWLLPWYVDDYMSLDATQQSELQLRLARQLDWHCRTQLPAYADFLRAVKADFEHPGHTISSDRVMVYLASLKAYWRDLMMRIGPDVADIMTTASDAQIDELFRNLERRNRELERTYVDPPLEEILHQRTERMVDRLEKWVGPLEDGQQMAIQGWSTQLGATADQWIANRRRMQAGFRQILAERRDNPAFKQDFITLLTTPALLRTARYQTRLDHHTRLTADLLAAIGSTLTRAQQTHLLAELETLSGDFEFLTCRKLRTGPPDTPTPRTP